MIVGASAVLAPTDSPFVKFTLKGDNPTSMVLSDVSAPWTNPTYMNAHTGPETTCTGGGCWSRYIDKKVFDLNLVDYDGNLLATMVLDGVLFYSTEEDQETFSGSSFWWGDATITKVDPDFNAEGNYFVMAEAWKNADGKGAFALIEEGQPQDSNVPVLQYSVDATRITPYREIIIIEEKHPVVDELYKDKQYTINIEGWGTLDYDAVYEPFKYQLFGEYDYVRDRSLPIGYVRASTITEYWDYFGWGKVWYDINTEEYHRTWWGYLLDHGSTGITDADGDGYYSNEDCDDLNEDIHPGATEIYGNNVDEDCSGADTLVYGTVSTSLYDLYHVTTDLYLDTQFYATVFTGDAGSYGDYELNANDPGTAYLKYLKAGFTSKQSPSFSIGIGLEEQNTTMQQNNVVAGSVTGSLTDLSLNPLNSQDLYVSNSSGIIQKLVSGEGTYMVLGLPDSQLSGEVYTITAPGCIVYGGTDIPIIKGNISNRDLYLDCGD